MIAWTESDFFRCLCRRCHRLIWVMILIHSWFLCIFLWSRVVVSGSGLRNSKYLILCYEELVLVDLLMITTSPYFYSFLILNCMYLILYLLFFITAWYHTLSSRTFGEQLSLVIWSPSLWGSIVFLHNNKLSVWRREKVVAEHQRLLLIVSVCLLPSKIGSLVHCLIDYSTPRSSKHQILYHTCGKGVTTYCKRVSGHNQAN